MMDWLRAIRKGAGMKQMDVARAVGMSQASYCAIEKGGSKPKVENAKKIAALLRFDWRRFFEEDDDHVAE